MATSKPFLASLLKVDVMPSEKSKVRKETKKSKMTLYEYFTDPCRLTWKDKLMGGIKKLLHLDKKEPNSDIATINITRYTKKQEDLLNSLEKKVDVVINKKTGITTISFTADDPAVAQQIADTISCRLQDMVIDYKTLKAKEKLKYYTKISDEARVRLINLQKNMQLLLTKTFL